MNGTAQERTLRIAAIAGDGIGPEIVSASLPVIAATARLDGVRVDVTELDWGGDRQIRTGAAMPDDATQVIRQHDAVLLGAVGHPDLTPDVSVWSLVLPLRKELDLYVNLRPIRALDNVESPVVDPAGTDFVVVRENTEGEYSGIGGRVHAGGAYEVATDVAVHSRRALTRIGRYAFELARRRDQRLTLVTKSNVSRHGYALCSNLFGDILSDLGAVLQGGLGMAASANLCPDGDAPGIFEPVHGSAPDIAGRGIANPLATILSGALLLRENGCPNGAEALEAAVAATVGRAEVTTPDIGGEADTAATADAVAAAFEAAAR